MDEKSYSLEIFGLSI